VRFSLIASGKWNCSDCTAKQKDKRNCGNRKKIKNPLRHVSQWKKSDPYPPLKVLDFKFLACPVSIITRRTWDILSLCNETLSAGESGDIIHLPFPGCLTDQPRWFRDAAQIVRSERSRHRTEMMEKARGK
jgi:hypothetical protein